MDTNSGFNNLRLQYTGYLAIIINAIFKFQYFSDDWKKAIVLIKKPSEEPSLAKNYTPVNLFPVPVLSKITVHIFLTHLPNCLPAIPE